MNGYYLNCRYDSRKSFYNKAYVDEDIDGSKRLYSYGTCVAYTDNCNRLHVCNLYEDAYSYTTIRHIREFARQNGYDWMSKNEIMKYIDE